MIMDGFGFAAPEGNAIAAANKPNLDKLFAENPLTQIGASGMDVGLPDGQMGNSEVGHTNIGAGRIVYQELTRITKAVQDGTFFENEALVHAMNAAKENGAALHLIACSPTAACTATTRTCTACWKWRSAWALRRSTCTRCWTAAMCRPPRARTTSSSSSTRWRRSASARSRP